MALAFPLALATLFALDTGDLHAQQIPVTPLPTERQEGILPERGIVEITPELRNRLGLFPGVPGFQAARLLRGDTGPWILEIEWREGGLLFRDRRPLAEAELTQLRGSFESLIAEAGTRAVASREGRGGFVLGQTLLGVGFHGWAVPAALDVNSGQGAVAAYLLTAGAAFYLPYRLTADRGVSTVHRNFGMYGGTRGIVSGLFLGDLVAGREDDGSGSSRARLAGGVLTGAAGSALSFAAVDRWNPTLGDAELWAALGDAGLLAGAAVAYLAGPYGTEEVELERPGFSFTTSRTRNARLGHTITLAGQGAGLLAGAWLSQRRAYAPGDVSVLRSATVLGVQTGATVARVAGAGEDDGEAWVAGMLAGGLVGLAAGDRWAAPRGVDAGEGLLVNAGHLAGGAVAAGIVYLVVDDIGDHATSLLVGSTLGSALGAGLVWRAVTDGAPRRDGRLAARWAPAGLPGGLSAEVHPAGILSGLSGRWEGPVGGAPARTWTGPPPVWLTIRF